jgi:hypothetical protein
MMDKPDRPADPVPVAPPIPGKTEPLPPEMPVPGVPVPRSCRARRRIHRRRPHSL